VDGRTAGCASCWAFSAVGVAEATWKKATGNTEVFSAQQILDCMPGNSGCNGGDTKAALSFLRNSTYYGGGLLRLADYPYHATQRDCTAKPSQAVGKIVVTYSVELNESIGNTMDMTLYLNAPLSILFDATTAQHYSGGILMNCSCISSPLCPSTVSYVSHSIGLQHWR
jgi:hypothetical protein